MYLDMPENFRPIPPKGRFQTQILHPNVNRHGRICHSILDRDWTPDTSLRNVLDTVYGLLVRADYTNPVQIMVASRYHHDQVQYVNGVREHVAKYARKERGLEAGASL